MFWIIIIIAAIIAFIVIRNKRRGNVRDTHQYTIYLKLLETLKNNGYELITRYDYRDYVGSTILHKSTECGVIFAVNSNFDDYEEISNTVNSNEMGWSTYFDQRFDNQGLTYWPKNSYVGAFIRDPSGPYRENNAEFIFSEWRSVVKIIGSMI